MSIGVFDSGIGGLTVLAALRAQLPQADLLYLGDTARVPYGRRSAATVASYAADCAQWLLDQGCEHLVIACNTASAYGADAVRSVAAGRPVYEVVGAGVDAACAAGGAGGVAVLATRGTVASQAYQDALQQRLPDTEVRAVACPLLVPLIEEGWYDHAAMDATIQTYLRELDGFDFNRLILGCTHYPLIRERLAQAVGEGVQVIDSAAAIASQLVQAGVSEGSGTSILAFSDDPALSEHAVSRIYPAPVHALRRLDWDRA